MSKKGKRVEERCLRLVLIEHTKNYLQLLEKAKRLRILRMEIFKTLQGSKPDFMKDTFHYSYNAPQKK